MLQRVLNPDARLFSGLHFTASPSFVDVANGTFDLSFPFHMSSKDDRERADKSVLGFVCVLEELSDAAQKDSIISSKVS